MSRKYFYSISYCSNKVYSFCRVSQLTKRLAQKEITASFLAMGPGEYAREYYVLSHPLSIINNDAVAVLKQYGALIPRSKGVKL